MNKRTQATVKEFCRVSFDQTKVLLRFGTLPTYERFCRKFYSTHQRFPRVDEIGKRHGKAAQRARPVRVKSGKKVKRQGSRVPTGKKIFQLKEDSDV